MSKITKNTENATKNQSLASEIIADQATKTKRLEVAVVALSIALLATATTKRKK